MEQAPLVTVVNRRPIRSLSIDRADLQKLLQKVQERCDAAGIAEAAAYSPPGLDAEQLEKHRLEIREGFRLFVSITGTDGTQLHGSIGTIFSSPNFPDRVQSVFFNSEIPLKNKNYYVANRCELWLDFSRPEVLNFSRLPSLETDNDSHFEAQGRDATWVNGIFHEVVAALSERPAALGWLHKHSVYDVLLWVAGFPFAFWCANRVSGLVFRLPGSFVQAAGFLYVALVALFGFRILFHYARWIWPLVEYRHANDRATRHKAVLVFILGGILVNLLTDVFKSLF